MGAAASHQTFVDTHEPLLKDFVGTQPVTSEGFWAELLTFPVPLTKLSPQDLEASALPFCEKLVKTNCNSHNFQTLLDRTLQKLLDVDTPERAQQATDAIVFLRIFIKYLTESLNSDDLVAFLDGPRRKGPVSEGHAETASSWVDELVAGTVNVLLHTEVRDATYLLHLETLHLLLVMISTQLYSPSPSVEPGGHPFMEVLMDAQEPAQKLMLTLLQHYIEHRPLPPKAPVYIPPPQSEKRGVLRLVRSAAASVLWLPLQALTFLVRSGNQQLAESPLGETGLLLLLSLLHHVPAAGHKNPFQQALLSLQDSSDSGEQAEVEAPSSSGSTGGISFPSVFRALGQNLTDERSVLLLYDLLHSCPGFRNFLVIQRDCGVVLLPLLQMLHAAVSRPASQMYMLLIVVLILSQDPVFSQNIHTVPLPEVRWYSERLLKDTSLGSLMVVLLLRTAHYNLSKLKDVYLHTNTLAALANLAPHMTNLTSHAAQRLVSLFDMLARRYIRLSQLAQEGRSSEAEAQEMQVYFDFLRIVLEIINCIIIRGLHQNPELVYALLHRQDVFMPFQDLPPFAELLENVILVIRFFNERIDGARGRGQFEWSVPSVLKVVKANLEEWPGRSELRQFPELRFTYEEDAHPEGFFVPYVWTLVVTHTTIPWRPQAIALFAPVSLGSEEAASLDGLAGVHEEGAGASPRVQDAADNV